MRDPRAVLEGVRLKPNGSVDGLELTIGPSGKARVRVLDALGNPVERAAVFARDEQGFLYEPKLNDLTTTSGRRTYRNLALGEFRFYAAEGERVSAWVQAGSSQCRVRG